MRDRMVNRRWRRWRQRLRMRLRLYKPRIQSLEGRIRRQRVIHVIHIGKTGGSAIKEAIRGDIRGVHSVYQDVAPGTRIITHSHHIDLSLVPAQDEVVFFLRDPVARYVSGFNSRQREGRPRFVHPWSAAERRAFERFPGADDLGVGIGSSDPETRAAAAEGMRRIGHVRTHFSDWLVSPRMLRRRRHRILLVGWLETIEDDFDRLARLIGLPPDRHLPSDPSVAHRAPGGQPVDLSEEAITNLRAWYRSDYELIDLLERMGLTQRPASR